MDTLMDNSYIFHAPVVANDMCYCFEHIFTRYPPWFLKEAMTLVFIFCA